MANKRNYQKGNGNDHGQKKAGRRCSCFAFTAVVRRAAVMYWKRCPNDFKITVFYYNPNIYPEEEYWKRVEEQKEFIRKLPVKYPISFLEGNYEKERFYQTVKGLEKIPEGGERCFACFRLRLGESVKAAEQGGFDYVTTTLTISPLKNAEKLNEIGEELCNDKSVDWLPSDFKKKNGYKRSTELSREYGMYRQDYCGCVFSLQERKGEEIILAQSVKE